MSWRARATLALLVSLALARAGVGQAPPGCAAEWIPTFGGTPFACEPDATVLALAEYDDGHGRALYAGGTFTTTSSATNYLAKWDGWGWERLGTGMGATEIRALCVFDDGSGPALFLGGSFTTIDGIAANKIAKWNGTSFSALGSGMSGVAGSSVDAFCVYDDGSGPALYAGGSFTSAGGVPANRIARWNGTSWSPLGSGTNAPVLSLGTYDDGTGVALYAGGGFITAGGIPAHNVARWNGASWSALGAGTTSQVKSFAVFDDGSGSALYAGGLFDSAGGLVAHHIARWNGTSWSPVGSGADASVQDLLVYDDGSGPALYAGGDFSIIGGLFSVGLARWSGSGWSSIGGLTGTSASVKSLASFDDGHGVRLAAAGHFVAAGSANAINHAAWDGQSWDQVGFGLDGSVHSAAIFDDGTGPALFVGGDFRHAGSTDARCIAKWDGTRWSALPWMYFLDVTTMAVYDDGSGPALFVGNVYSGLGLARWDGATWTLPAGGLIGAVRALLVFDDGSGPALYSAAGTDGTSVVSIAKWDGSTWTPLGSGMSGPILTLAAFDDGSGPALYAGGYFVMAGGTTVNGIARWNGTNWLPLGAGVSGSNISVYSLAVLDDGTGQALYATGPFTSAGGVPANGLAKWDGSSWHPVGGGLSSSQPGAFGWRLAAFDDGAGPGLFVAGSFSMAGSTPTGGFAKWNGTNWTDMAFSTSTPSSLSVLDDGTPGGEALLVGGFFQVSPAGDAALAKWDFPLHCTPVGNTYCEPGIGSVMPCPCFNPASGPGRGCGNSSATGGARLFVTGLPSLANDLVRLTTSDELPSALSVFVQGTNTIPNGVLFGQGVRCVAGALTRLYVKSAANGIAIAPGAADAPVSVRSLALGDPIVAGQRRYYGVYYRDPFVLNGCPATSTFNITQQVDLLWTP